MSAAAATEAAPVAPKKKGGAMKMVLAILVTAAVAGGGAFYAAQHLLPPPAAPVAGEAAEEAPAASGGHDEHGGGAPVTGGDYFSLAPSFVVNLNDEDVSRFLQIEVEVMAVKPAALDAVRANLPVIRNRLVLLFSSQKFRDLLPREGKEKLQQQSLEEINKLLEERKKPRIDGVMFTSFVMQ
ncbi:flagellar basal body-associated FliL family protein [Stagnimonas aquatica]|nr:flagellar basal body-associated FliL family protein [Stagnimonas aquatica]